MDKCGVIIVAGGEGSRMGGQIPKQFLPLGREGKPVLVHTIERFLDALPEARIVVALPENQTGYWEQMAEEHGIAGKHDTCAGGRTRFHSVRNALAKMEGCTLVAVHDGVRPLAGRELILRAMDTARKYGSAVPAITPADSFRIAGGEGTSRTMDRELLRAVQTPQAFMFDILRKAYESPYDPRFTDDAGVVENAGYGITLFEGQRTNIKITTPEDLAVAEALMAAGDRER